MPLTRPIRRVLLKSARARSGSSWAQASGYEVGFEAGKRWLMDALLSDEAIECAARALNLDAGRQRGLTFEDDWDELTEQERGGWRNCARAALTAVTSTGKREPS